MGKGGTGGTVMSIIKTPLGIIVLFAVMLILSGLTAFAAISGELTAAAVTGASLLVLIILLLVVTVLGK